MEVRRPSQRRLDPRSRGHSTALATLEREAGQAQDLGSILKLDSGTLLGF